MHSIFDIVKVRKNSIHSKGVVFIIGEDFVKDAEEILKSNLLTDEEKLKMLQNITLFNGYNIFDTRISIRLTENEITNKTKLKKIIIAGMKDLIDGLVNSAIKRGEELTNEKAKKNN